MTFMLGFFSFRNRPAKVFGSSGDKHSGVEAVSPLCVALVGATRVLVGVVVWQTYG